MTQKTDHQRVLIVDFAEDEDLADEDGDDVPFLEDEDDDDILDEEIEGLPGEGVDD